MNDAAFRSPVPSEEPILAGTHDAQHELSTDLVKQLIGIAETAIITTRASSAGWVLHKTTGVAAWDELAPRMLTGSRNRNSLTSEDALVVQVELDGVVSTSLVAASTIPVSEAHLTPVLLRDSRHVADLVIVGADHERGGQIWARLLISLARQAEIAIACAIKAVERLSDSALGAKGFDALRAREQELRLVVDSSPSMLAYWDRDLRNRFANEAYATWFGVEPEKIRGQHISELLGEELFRKNQPFLAAALGGSEQVFERELLTPSGVRHSLARYQPHVLNGQVVGVLVEVTDVSRLKVIEQQLRGEIKARHETESQLRTLLDDLEEARGELGDLYQNAPCGYYSLDFDGKFVRVNKAMEEILETPAAELLAGKLLWEFATPDSAEQLTTSFRRLRDRDIFEPYELDLISGTGEARHVRVYATAVRTGDGTFVRTRSAMVDITELHDSRKQLESVVRDQHAMLNSDLIGIMRIRRREVVWVNRAFERMFEYGVGEIVGRSTRQLHLDRESYMEQGRQAYPFLQAQGTYRTQMRLRKKSGEPIWVDMSGAMLSLESDESLWMAQDITALQAQKESVEAAAFHDSLTGLTNRAGFMRWMGRALLERQGTTDLLALCFIDLDGFKPVNDIYGHDTGDEVLKVIAQRLLQSIRADDLAVRLGGDEFLVVLPHTSSHEKLQFVCDRLIKDLRQPITFLTGANIQVSASVGVSLCPEHATTLEGLLRCADEAMYQAKSAGRDNWTLFRGG